KNMIDADGESYYGTLGGLYRRQNRHEDAMKMYEEAFRVTPQSSYPAGNLAVLYKYLGRDNQAADVFNRVEKMAQSKLEENPADSWTRLDDAQAKLVLGRKDEALHEYEILIGQSPQGGTLETGISGLEFLAQSPTPIDGIQEAIAMLKKHI